MGGRRRPQIILSESLSFVCLLGFYVLTTSADEEPEVFESAPINFQIVLFCWSLNFAGQKIKPEKTFANGTRGPRGPN